MIIGKKIIRYKIIDSTNDEAKRLINKGEGEGLVVVAQTQTRGRGKPGSVWLSPSGNLYLSVVIKPYKNPKDLAPITLLGALAARAMIAKVSKLAAVIKWPNDLLLHGKKVAGILTERLAGGEIIVGIGLNVNTAPNGFASLAGAAKKKFFLPRCFKALLAELDREYLAYLAEV